MNFEISEKRVKLFELKFLNFDFSKTFIMIKVIILNDIDSLSGGQKFPKARRFDELKTKVNLGSD